MSTHAINCLSEKIIELREALAKAEQMLDSEYFDPTDGFEFIYSDVQNYKEHIQQLQEAVKLLLINGDAGALYIGSSIKVSDNSGQLCLNDGENHRIKGSNVKFLYGPFSLDRRINKQVVTREYFLGQDSQSRIHLILLKK